jgi:hypothetical protein
MCPGTRRMIPLALYLVIALPVALVTPGCARSARESADPQQGDNSGGSSKEVSDKVGLHINKPGAFQGYTLLQPMTSARTYLLDMQGNVVRMWQSDCYPALSAYLLDNGHLLRTGTIAMDKRPFGGAGAGGRIQEFTWDGEVVWDFIYSNDKQLPHHDVARLPNGNVLLIVWENKTAREAIAAGRKQRNDVGQLRPDCVLEIKPTGKTTGKVVWEWHVWDHLIQDHDSSEANFGDVSAHPERIDVNFGAGEGLAPLLAKKDGADKLRSIGYLRSSPRGRAPNPGWTHINSVAYNPDLDQIILSVLGFSEIWIIDHGTSAAEAAGHKGGKSGKGGDLLYRWGNPRAYRAGTVKDQRLFSQHAAHWIPRGLPGEGHLLNFNNGVRRPGGNFSTVDEIAVPGDSKGRYDYRPGAAHGPQDPVWSYRAPIKTDLYSELLSSAQRLPNGNTLICSGMNGRLFEVTGQGDVVWEYFTPPHAGPPVIGLPPVKGGSAPKSTSVFRASRYAPSYPGLVGKDLTPWAAVEKLQPKGE